MRMIRLAVIAAALIAVACDEDPTRPMLGQDGELQVRPGLVRTMPGASTSLDVVAFDDADRPVFPGSVTWSSLDSDIVSVDAGVITALEPGWGRIVARTSSGQRDTAHVAVGLDLVGVSVGREHACGWTEDGEAWCWGGPGPGNRGSLGTGALPAHATPLRVAGGLSFSTVVAGSGHSCGIAEGSIYCWGSRTAVPVQCTIEINFGCHTPTRIINGTFEHLAASGLQSTTCATGPAGLVCWGQGQAVAGCTYCWPPVQFDVLTGPVALGYFHGCALDGDGRAYCWGSNTANQLGVDEIPAEYCASMLCDRTYQPIPVNTTVRFVDITAGGYVTCGLVADGETLCWGTYVSHPEVGPGATPAPVDDVLRFAAIDAGDRHVCGLSAEGRAYCWGNGASEGAMGEPASEEFVPEPRAIAHGMTFSSVSGGNGVTCAASRAGGMYCSGTGYSVGQGWYTRTSSMVPVAPPGPLPAYVPWATDGRTGV